MSLSSERSGDVVIVHAAPARLMHPWLSEFALSVTGQLSGGETKLVIDFGKVEYLDSAAVGCLMDLYRQASHAGATLKLAAVQSRVETMLTLVGANQFMEMYPDAAAAVNSF
jgi:anti-sigma B factor antagonist